MTTNTPQRTLLNIYQPNRLRLNSLQSPLTMTLTKWINEAISEKLDRALPGTAGVSPMTERPVSTLDPMAEQAEKERQQAERIKAEMVAAANEPEVNPQIALHAKFEAMEDDADFWGETFLKVKAKAGK